jgi:hypothetical protein
MIAKQWKNIKELLPLSNDQPSFQSSPNLTDQKVEGSEKVFMRFFLICGKLGGFKIPCIFYV